MKSLSKIILVNWYLLDGVELEIEGNTAIVGPNGSGKSSILDAVQTVLTGRDRARLNLNAGASGKGKRSVYEYCLGVISNAAGQNVYFRKNAHTYITLVFYDNETNSHTTVGLAMTASSSGSEETVESRFVIPGMNACLSDFVRHTGNDQRSAIPWIEVKSTIDRLHPNVIYYKNNAKQFVSELLTQLSEDPGCPMIDTDQFLKNLQNAIAFVPIGDPTMFVRNFILQHNDLSIVDELRIAMKNYEEMNEKHQQVSARIEELTQIETACKKVKTYQQDLAYYKLVNLKSNIESHIERSEQVRITIDETEELQLDCQKKRKEIAEKHENLLVQVNKARNELENSSVKARITKLKQQKELSYNKETTHQKDLDTIHTEIAQLLHCSKHYALLPPDLVTAHQTLTDHVAQADELLQQLWPSQPQQVDHDIQTFLSVQQQTRSLRRDKQDSYVTLKAHTEEKRKSVATQVKQLRLGESPLSRDTLDMIAVLKANNIESRPLCDLCDVTDEKWRLTIEGILKGNREALIVDKNNAHEAVRLYRQHKHKRFSAKVVNTTQSSRWMNKATEHSLATIVTTDDSDAQAFINRQLGNIEMVDTEKQLLACKRAATADGLFLNGGVVSSIKDPSPYPILGRESQARLLAQLEKDLIELQQQLDDVTTANNNLNTAENKISAFVNFCDRQSQSIATTKQERENANQQTTQLAIEIAELEQNQDTALLARITQLDSDIAQLKKESGELEKTDLEFSKTIGGKEKTYEDLQARVDKYEAQIKEHTNQPLWTNETWVLADATDLFIKLQDRFDGDYQQIIAHCSTKQDNVYKRLNKEENTARSLTKEHYSRYARITSSGTIDTTNLDELSTHISCERQMLIDTELANYADKSQQALQEAEIAFRSKFIFKVKESIDKVKSQLSELNRTLKKIIFHGERYVFKWAYNPEYKNIVKLFDAIDDNPNLNLSGLFDPSNDPTSPHYDAIQEINAALKDQQQSSRLEDYRSYFIFDIEMYSQNGELKSNMRNRITKGSGGEGQSPYYVAIGAALASTYYLRSTNNDVKGGMHLIMFDEAFSKLDVENCGNCLNFLQDINLQVLLGAPDEKHTILSASMDTIINIYREEQAIDISIEYPKKAAHLLLQQDNPTINKPAIAANVTGDV